jgi:predicted dehydrogenase
MKDKLRVGIIGAGWIANHHAEGYLKSGRARVVAVCDQSEQQALGLMERHGLKSRYCADYRSLLEQEDIDAVSICVPNKFHSELTVAAARAGKHILCEKPFVTSMKEAKQSLAAIQEFGVRCAVGFHRRFNPLYREMKRRVDDGSLGDVFFCQCDYIHNQMHLPIIAWQLKKEFNPSLFHAGASHCVDLLRWLTGEEIMECTAFVSTKSCPACETEAETVALYRFANGALGKVMRIAPTPIAGFEFHLEVYGTKGTFRDRELRLDSFPSYWEPRCRGEVVTYPDWVPNNSPGPTEPWDVEVGRFVEWALDGGDAGGLCTAVEAVRVAEACWAAVISSREKRVVSLPLAENT